MALIERAKKALSNTYKDTNELIKKIHDNRRLLAQAAINISLLEEREDKTITDFRTVVDKTQKIITKAEDMMLGLEETARLNEHAQTILLASPKELHGKFNVLRTKAKKLLLDYEKQLMAKTQNDPYKILQHAEIIYSGARARHSAHHKEKLRQHLSSLKRNYKELRRLALMTISAFKEITEYLQSNEENILSDATRRSIVHIRIESHSNKNISRYALLDTSFLFNIEKLISSDHGERQWIDYLIHWPKNTKVFIPARVKEEILWNEDKGRLRRGSLDNFIKNSGAKLYYVETRRKNKGTKREDLRIRLLQLWLTTKKAHKKIIHGELMREEEHFLHGDSDVLIAAILLAEQEKNNDYHIFLLSEDKDICVLAGLLGSGKAHEYDNKIPVIPGLECISVQDNIESLEQVESEEPIISYRIK